MPVKERTALWEETPDVNFMLPKMAAQVVISDIDEQESSTGKSMLLATLTVVQPAEAAGSTHTERFVIGSDADPTAQQPSTLGKDATYGFRLFKKMLAKAGVPFNSNNLAQTCATAIGSQLLVEITHNVDTKPGEYQGRVRAELKGFYRIGERQPELLACTCPQCTGTPWVPSDGPQVTHTAAPPTTSPAPPVAAAAAPPTPPAAPAKASKKAQQAPPVVPPVAPPQVVPPQAPPAAAAAPQGEQILTCPLCQAQVPRSQLTAHMQQCQQAAVAAASAPTAYPQES